MENFIFSFNIVSPVFLLVLLGWFVRKVHIIDDKFIDTASKLNFKFGLSTLLFLNIYQTPITKVFDWKFIAFIVGSCLSIGLILCVIVPIFVKDNRKASAMIHTVFKPNVIVLGFPLAQMMFGSAHMSSMSMVLPFIIPLNNIAAVIILAAFDKNKDFSPTQQLKKTLVGIVKNPLIMASVAAILLEVTRVPLPGFLMQSCSTLSDMAVPLALITLGAQIKFQSAMRDMKYALTATVCKILISPLILVPIAIALGYRDYQLATIFLISASPSAVNSYVLAKEMHSDEILTGEVILMTTFFSLFTLFLGICILKSFSLIS